MEELENAEHGIVNLIAHVLDDAIFFQIHLYHIKNALFTWHKDKSAWILIS